MDYIELQDIQNVPSAYVKQVDNKNPFDSDQGLSVRRSALIDSAFSISVQAGMAYQLRRINIIIDRNSRRLDTIYDFSPLMIESRVIPPVIIEAHSIYSQEDNFTIRLSDRFYHIDQQARFSSRPPNWRDYLSFEVPKVDRSSLLNRVLPRDEAERQLWKTIATDGWNQGIQQANYIFIAGLDRLNRDFTGMLRFKILELEGKVSMPVISSASLPISNTGDTLVLDETLLRISRLPTFNSDINRWKASPATSRQVDPTRMVPVWKQLFKQ